MKGLFLLICLLCCTMRMNAVDREENYYPEGESFVCINGGNLYSRALYGSNDSDWRIETSDRPIFATYKKGAQRAVSFRIGGNGVEMALDSASWCKASYTAGRRDYELRDSRLGDGRLFISVLAYPDREGAIWRFRAEGLDRLAITGIVSTVKGKKFSRYGDLGTNDMPEKSFRPDMVLFTMSQELENGGTVYFSFENDSILTGGGNAEMADLFGRAELYRARLSGSVRFSTPDRYINPIGGVLVMAADGAWGGQVWMHGAVGWRMPLPGWRGAYAGDFLGMPERQRKHFDAYAKSQVTGVPVTQPHLMDEKNNLARGEYKWGTPMYSDGYICRNPENNRQFHHYDMNLVYIDELLWHFQFDADTAYMRKMWPVLRSHLAWEKNTWDPDGDHLYDAYCCIWASDALQYSSGAVTHSSAYNYRGNLLAARIAETIGEDATPYKKEAEEILKAMNERLWIEDEGHWAEFQDFMGKKLLHKDAALWSIYTPIDCGSCTPEQAYQATKYVDRHIPHFYFNGGFYTISTSDWQPYEWSLNNVAMAEVLHTALAYWKAGRADDAYQLLKGTVMDFMYCGSSPANFGQISKFDVNIGEAYRDFADVSGIASRTFIEGLYGITPDALNGRCIIRPGFPSDWDSAAVKTPYLEYSFKHQGGKDIYTIKQRFSRPLQIVLRQNLGEGRYKDTALTNDSVQTIVLDTTARAAKQEDKKQTVKSEGVTADGGQPQEPVLKKGGKGVSLTTYFNANVTDLFEQKYLSPRSPYTTLALPVQGIGDWCSTKRMAKIDDSGLRKMAKDGKFTAEGITFETPHQGHNIIYTSLWDNYPDCITIPLKGRGSRIYLLMAGSTNPMQSHIENGAVRITYNDGTSEVLILENPTNWCPIEQDYDDGSPAFTMPQPRPLRVSLKTGMVSRSLAKAMNVERVGKVFDDPTTKVAALAIDGGAAEVLSIELNPKKKLKALTVSATANDVVIGLMAATILK